MHTGVWAIGALSGTSTHLRIRRQAMLWLAAVDEDTKRLAWCLPVRPLILDDLPQEQEGWEGRGVRTGR